MTIISKVMQFVTGGCKAEALQVGLVNKRTHMTKKTTAADAATQLQTKNHCIPHSVALGMVWKYKTFRSDITDALNDFGGLPFNVPDFRVAMTYNRNAIACLLEQQGCEAIRIYPAVNKNNVLTLIMVGVDGLGENIIGTAVKKDSAKNSQGENISNDALIDEAQTCPPHPARKKPLLKEVKNLVKPSF